jgi:hypothetical protein
MHEQKESHAQCARQGLGWWPRCIKVQDTVTDEKQAGGQRLVTYTFIALFARANREEDYRTAWAFFEGPAK